jgi:formamidopyrimidine-DNA glycosylase
MIDTKSLHESNHLNDIGPEPLDQSFTFEKFASRLSLKAGGKIKQVLMDQSIIAGIGNIYADESLWCAGIHPATRVTQVYPAQMRSLFKAIKHTLSTGIDFGGDSMSDYRNIHGEKGEFQESHHAYKRRGSKCDKKGCGGTIVRIVLGGRGTHFCNKHQILRK